jgi:hypothetical protein
VWWASVVTRLEVGDVVRHKSGGPQLAVLYFRITDDKSLSVVCAYLFGPHRAIVGEVSFFPHSLVFLWRHPLPQA